MDARTPSDTDLKDMQALIGSGFGSMKCSEYLLLEITCGAKARAWLTDVLNSGCVLAVADLPKRLHGHVSATSAPQRHETWSIAFTHRGLTTLGIVDDPGAPFPSEFRTGQADENRRRLLREDPSIPWLWSDVPVPSRANPPAPVSMLVLRLYDDKANAAPLLETQSLVAAGLAVVRRVHGSPDSFRTVANRTQLHEPFGFRDGISQPEIQGLYFRESTYLPGTTSESKRVPLGEFVLGYPNIYGEISHCPKVKATAGVKQDHAFGRNGCYLAAQQIVQHVDAFERFDKQHSASGNEPSLTEKMVGRRKCGRPLQEVPRRPASLNGFGFRQNDPRGLQCPVGAHIRRANPRDSLPDSGNLGSPESNLHRLLRRGRPFRSDGAADGSLPSPVSVPAGAKQEVGLFFLAIVADLARQFEFVKRVWIGNPSFGDLCGEPDPLLGRASNRRFTIPAQPTGDQARSLPDFTTMQGGGYFFMPGMRTLAGIARGDYVFMPGGRTLADVDGGDLALVGEASGPTAPTASGAGS